jgi:hypothetical protein
VGSFFPFHWTFTVRLALTDHLKSGILVNNLTGFILVRSALSFSSEQCRCALHPAHRNGAPLAGPYTAHLRVSSALLGVSAALFLGASSVIPRPEDHLAELLLLDHTPSPPPHSPLLAHTRRLPQAQSHCAHCSRPWPFGSHRATKKRRGL